MKKQTKAITVFILFILFAFQIDAQVDTTMGKFPKLGFKKFSGWIAPENNAGIITMACYGLGDMGVYSVPPGASLGICNGFGSYQDTIYDFTNISNVSSTQQVNNSVRQLRPDFKVYSHLMGPSKIELNNYFGSTSENPKRYLVDNVSPKWFAYTVLSPLDSAVSSNPFDTLFYFDSLSIKRIYQGLKNKNIPDSAMWLRSNVYDWTYFCFKDNDSNATRGNFEIMAIKKVDTINNVVTVAQKRENGDTLGRTIFGNPMSYSVGDRAGLLASGEKSLGTPAIRMNLYYNPSDPLYQTEMLADTNDPNSDWFNALAEFTAMTFMKAEYNGVYLCDGVSMDTDGEIWDAPTYHLAERNQYFMDMNWDGAIDNIDTVDVWLPIMYEHLITLIQQKAQSLNRDFFVVRNGTIRNWGNSVGHISGRSFEDFAQVSSLGDGGYSGALNQYMMIQDTMNTASPHIVLLCERDRDTCDQFMHNYKEHRHKMALTTVLGNGFYCHTGAHATHLYCWGNVDDSIPSQGPEDWYDEFAVDSLGTSAQLLPASSALDTAINRANNINWLGYSLGKGYKIDSTYNQNLGWLYTFRRDFKNGIVIYSQYPHTVNLDTTYRKILGVDPGNDGSMVDSIVFNEAKMGVFLLRNSLITDVENINSKFNINVYPNPAKDEIIVAFSENNQNINIELIDITGKIILQKKLNNITEQYRINTSNLKNGIYLLIVKSNKCNETKKILISK